MDESDQLRRDGHDHVDNPVRLARLMLPGPEPVRSDGDESSGARVASGPWTASLDLDGSEESGTRNGPVDTGRGAAKPAAVQGHSPRPRASARTRRIRGGVLAVILGAFAATWLAPLLRDPPPVPRPQVAVIGAHLDAPVELRLPAGAVATSDGSYLGLRLAGGGAVMVTMPTEVVDPDGEHHRLPSDPVAWLQHNPAVFVSRVAPVEVDGRAAVQVDYRWAAGARPVSRIASLQLFCGWRAAAPARGLPGREDAQACPRITSGARVRATFVQVGGRTVLFEMVWRADVGHWPIPRALRQGYATLLQGLTARPV